MRQVIARTLRAAVFVFALTLAQSVFWSPQAPWPFSVLVASLGVLTAWRPAWGLLALAFLAPFGRMLAVVWLGGFPIRGAEALALACLAGVALRWAVRRPPLSMLPARIVVPWVLFAASAVASAAVLWRVSQLYLDYPTVMGRQLLTFLAVGYQDLPGEARLWLEPVGFGYVTTAALIVEGVALMLVAGRLCACTAGLARRLVVASVLAGSVAAAMSSATVIGTMVSADDWLNALVDALTTERWALHISKVNTAGSYFVLVGTLAVGLAVRDRDRRRVWLVASTIIGVGLWLTASLAATLSGVVVAMALGAAWALKAARHGRRLDVAFALAAILALVLFAGLRLVTRGDAIQSFERRVAITRMSLDVAAERPLFGVGIGTYALRSHPHLTDAVKQGFGGAGEAHNYVLQIAAELGVVGLVLYLGALVATFRQAARAAGPGAPWAAPAAAAVAAFLLSALAGQPMLVDSVAIPVWLVMGVLAGGAPATPAGRGSSMWLAVGIAALVVSVPLRMQREVAEIDPRRAGYGTTLVRLPSGQPAHVLEGRATLFVSAAAPAIDLEAAILEHTNAREVYLRAGGDGLPGKALLLSPDGPRVVCLQVDPARLRAGGLRAVAVDAVTATGEPAPPESVWAAARGRDHPCGR